ncbi:hypothetical protein G7072_13770 [Nocardioides sp. HDW12B]|uniref:DUF6603 domain-containing protein n=1 Tax=Nocardioides sp. HDW12B TaxID=2714939 RepID=UPI00140D2EBE|nr:DUF6603 domain-containing protein [Nocardioides sp. HDW12B]QIK67272.1 hypothetical protein G7072_13770 [Nocardioides sp. HDW12B]
MTEGLPLLVSALAAAAPDPATARVRLEAAAQQVRAAAAGQVQAALQQWRTELAQVAGGTRADAERLIGEALALPPIPGLDAGLARTIFDGDPRMLAGWRTEAPLGPLAMRAQHTAVTTARAQGEALLVGLLPASGLAGALDAGPTKLRGGFLVDADRRGATGHLSFNAGAIAAGALGRLAVDGGTVSFVAILGARFTPGIQLGFGFEISSLGGVVGVNVGVDSDVLRRRLREGTALALFFPADPSAGDRLLPAVRETFTSRSGSVVVGPSVELTWLQVGGASLLRISLVLLLELPRGRVLVLGRGAVAIPPMLDLRLDLLGEIDVPRGYYAVDLAVVEGRVMGIFRAGGTAAMRISTARPAYTLFTLGGFYPGYRTQVPGLPEQRRISFGPSIPLPLTFRFEGYLAFTGGTFQAGARFEIGFDVGILSAHGFLSFDAIAQLDPFHLHVDLHGGVEIEALGIDFAGVDFHGSLDAPGPVVVRGRVRVSFMGAKASWNDRFVLGSSDRAPEPPLAERVAAALAAEVVPANISGTAGHDPHVVLDAPSRTAEGVAVVHPLGAVRWSQTLAPLDHDLQRVQGRRVGRTTRVGVANLAAGGTAGVVAPFAPASFRDADRDQLLSLPAFEDLPSGVEVPLLPSAAAARDATLDYRNVFAPGDRLPSATTLALSSALLSRLAASQGPAETRLKDARLSVGPEAWSVRELARPDRADEARSWTASVVDAATDRAAGRDAVALPLGEPAFSVADVWGAP